MQAIADLPSRPNGIIFRTCSPSFSLSSIVLRLTRDYLGRREPALA
jgi:hypothetical protein